MESFAWKDRFSVHVDEMDMHHKKLFEYFAALQNEIQAGNATQKIEEILGSLVKYSALHFSAEERLMKAMNHPGLDRQINQHAYFINEVNEMSKQQNTETLPSRSVVAFLRDWFVNHILNEDSKYGEMMKQGKALR